MSQFNVFELLYQPYVLPKKVRLFEAFAGIGCQRLAFKRIGVECEMVGISEIDKYAIQSYMAIHGDTKNYGDISKIKGRELPQIDVFTYSYPCTDLSKAGKRQGMSEETRSGLVYEVLRILHECTDNKPKVLIMENVVDLVQAKFIEQFNEIQLELEELGYKNYVDTLNAKDYGVAQNRDRVFMVSILGDYYYEFPKPIPLEKRLKDYLEDEVDEKYYLSDKLLNFFVENSKKNEEKGNGFRFKPKDEDNIANTITTLSGNRMDDNFIKEPIRLGGIFDKDGKRHQAGSIWDKEQLSPTLDTMQGGHRQPFITEDTEHFIPIPEATTKGYAKAYEGDGVYINRPHQKRGVVQKEMIQTLKTNGNDVGVVVNPLKDKTEYGWHFEQNVYSEYSCTRALKSSEGSGNRPKVIQDLRIRKLTPLECWRLMGIEDSDFYKAQQVCSNSQLYKQAGNGIVIDVFAAILGKMLDV